MFKKGRVEPGCYQFPVSFVLPTKIPTSFNLTKNSATYARIRYTVTGKFLGGNGGWFKNEFKLIDEEEITVVKYYKSHPTETNKKLNSPYKCCCRQQGVAIMEASFDKKIYHPGETAKFTAKVDTKSLNANISDLQGQCYQTVTVRCSIYTRYWTKVIGKSSKGAVKQGTQEVFTMTPEMPTKYNEMSTFGSLVTCNYFLGVSCKMNCLAVYLACANEPQLSFPILVCQSQAKYQELHKPKPTAYPPEWKPEYHEVKVITFGGRRYNSYQNYTKGMEAPYQFRQGNAPRRGSNSHMNNKTNQKNNNSNKRDDKNKSTKESKKMLAPPQPSAPQITFNTNESERQLHKPLNKIVPEDLKEPVTNYASNNIQFLDESPEEGTTTQSNPLTVKPRGHHQDSNRIPLQQKIEMTQLQNKILIEDESEDDNDQSPERKDIKFVPTEL